MANEAGDGAGAPPEIGEGRGFIFAATGARYVTLARRAARTLKGVMPEARVDLFTDAAGLSDPVFDRIHVLADGFRRPKMEALRRTRFGRTVYLDADVIVLADVSELFDALDHCDIAGVVARARTRRHLPPGSPIPRALAPINSGVLAVRTTERMRGFMARWEKAARADRGGLDQPSLRRLLVRSRLRFLPLGMEYNFNHLAYLEVMDGGFGAPRILHASRLNLEAPGDPLRPLAPADVLSRRRLRHLQALMRADHSLGGSGAAVDAPLHRGLVARLRRAILRRLPRDTVAWLRRRV